MGTEAKGLRVTDEMVAAASEVLRTWKMPSGWQTAARLALEAALTAADAATGAPGGEVVAWSFELARARTSDGEYLDWGPPQLSFTEPNVPYGSIRNLRPLYALPPPPQAGAGEVRVKPLEWVKVGYTQQAETPLKAYIIQPVDNDMGPHWEARVENRGMSWSSRDTEDEIKAAVQADYIRSSLVEVRVSDYAAKRIIKQLAEEGGGTWAAYMWIEIEEAFGIRSSLVEG